MYGKELDQLDSRPTNLTNKADGRVGWLFVRINDIFDISSYVPVTDYILYLHNILNYNHV